MSLPDGVDDVCRDAHFRGYLRPCGHGIQHPCNDLFRMLDVHSRLGTFVPQHGGGSAPPDVDVGKCYLSGSATLSGVILSCALIFMRLRNLFLLSILA